MTNKFTIIFLLLTGVVTDAAISQISVTDFPFIEEIANPYARALGEADITSYHGGGLTHLNPAFDGREGFVRLGSNFTPRFIIVPDFKTQPNREFAPDVFFVTPHLGVEYEGWDASYQFRYYNLGEFRNESGVRIDGAEGIQELAVSRSFSDRFRAGVSLNFYQSDRGFDPRGPTTGASMHFGAIYRDSFHLENFSLYPSLGWSLVNFGRAKEYALGFGHSPQPTTMRLGGSLRLELPARYDEFRIFAATIHTAISRLIVGYNQNTLVPFGSFEALLRSWDNYLVRDGDDFVEISLLDQIRRHVGLEITLFEIIKLRGGYRHRPDVLKEKVMYTAGLGIDMEYIRLDASHVFGDFRSDYGNTLWMLTVAAPLEWVITSFAEE